MKLFSLFFFCGSLFLAGSGCVVYNTPSQPISTSSYSTTTPLGGRYGCQTDDDCVNSCSFGAVNKKWRENKVDECDDGCSGRWMGHPRCISGECAAFDAAGKRRKECTRVK